MGKGLPSKISTSFRSGLFVRPLSALLLLSLLATLIYSNAFAVPFFNDDYHIIVIHPWLRNLSNFWNLSGTRYVGFLSFALNYHFGGLNLFGYHLINLLIHIANGFLVFNLVSLLLFRAVHRSHSTGQTQGSAPTASWIALATALLFVAHPIQTQAVTYIVQRFASLAALFYLLTVVCYLKWRLAPSGERSRYLWYGTALLSTILAMKTKENSFTLPSMILSVEAVFFRPITHKRWASLVPFLLMLLIIPLSHIDALGTKDVGQARETIFIGRLDYLFTQFRVIVTYIRLLFLPIHQNMLYDYPIYHSFFELPVFLSFLFLLSLFALSLYLLFNSKFKTHHSQLIAFGLLWFFLTLSIESSIIPVSDVIFEHRVYLPSVGFFLSLSIAASHFLSLISKSRPLSIVAYPASGIMFFSLILLILSAATYHRNGVWKDHFTFWSDVVAKSPKSGNGHNFLGLSYQEQGRLDEAVQEYRAAIQFMPNHSMAHNNLGTVYQAQGRLDEAVQEYRTALLLLPGLAETHFNLGAVYEEMERLDNAVEEYQSGLKIDPNDALAHKKLADVLSRKGRTEEAEKEYQVALRLQPASAVTHYNLGAGLIQQGRLDEAIREFQAAIRLDPDYQNAHYNLGLAYANQGKLIEAIAEFQTVIRLKPNDAAAHAVLGDIYKDQGKLEEAMTEYQATLRLDPNQVEAHYSLGLVYGRSGKLAEAKREYEQALQLKPDFLPARKAMEFLPK